MRRRCASLTAISSLLMSMMKTACGQSVHVLHATEVGAQLREVGLGGHALADRKQSELALALVALEVVQAADALADRAEVGQQAAEPTVVDVRHARGLRDVLDGVARLLLGPHEEDGAAALWRGRRRTPRVLQELLVSQQVDDVDPVALAEDEAAHLGVPAARLVAEMDAGLQQLSDAYLWHWYCSLVGVMERIRPVPRGPGTRAVASVPGRAPSCLPGPGRKRSVECTQW